MGGYRYVLSGCWRWCRRRYADAKTSKHTQKRSKKIPCLRTLLMQSSVQDLVQGAQLGRGPTVRTCPQLSKNCESPLRPREALAEGTAGQSQGSGGLCFSGPVLLSPPRGPDSPRARFQAVGEGVLLPQLPTQGQGREPCSRLPLDKQRSSLVSSPSFSAGFRRGRRNPGKQTELFDNLLIPAWCKKGHPHREN